MSMVYGKLIIIIIYTILFYTKQYTYILILLLCIYVYIYPANALYCAKLIILILRI